MVHRSTVGSLLLFCSVVVFLPREQLLLLVVLLLLLVEGNGTSLGRLLKTILSLCSGTFSRLGAVFVYSWVHVAAVHDRRVRERQGTVVYHFLRATAARSLTVQVLAEDPDSVPSLL